MTTVNGPDRRMHPRWRLQAAVDCRLHVRTRVRLLDISLTGALLGAAVPFPVGTEARLQSAIGTTPFLAAVNIRRVAQPDETRSSLALGSIFTSMDPRSRLSLQAFFKMAGS